MVDVKIYIKQRDEFKENKIKYDTEKSEHQTKINNLEKRIEWERPHTKNGRTICPECDCVSMEHKGKVPNGGGSYGGLDIYVCEICEYQTP